MLLNEFLAKNVELNPHKVALICGGERLTFNEINNAANSIANTLIEEGFQKQERAAIYLENSVESIISLFGILKAGGVFVFVHPQIKAKKFEYMLKDCEARVLVTDTDHLTNINEILPHIPSLKLIIVTDYQKDNLINTLSIKTKILSYRILLEERPSTYIPPRCIDTDLASLIYTSGSSGNPKGVMLTHHNMVSAATSITQYLKNTSDDIIINTLSLAFDYGLYQVLMAFKFSGTVVLEKAFVYPQEIINTIVKEKVTGWPIVPTIAAILIRLKSLNKNNFSNLRYITSTSQVLPPKHIAKLREIFPNVEIYSMYGLTECKRVSYLNPKDLDKKPSSVGKAIPNTEAYIVNENDEEIVVPRTPGELVVRGSSVMKGYWNLPKETARTLRPGRYPGDKVLYTGDIFEKDEEGYLYFLGRKDSIIKTTGYMVSPKEVENVLSEKDDVIEAAVIGVDDEILGNAIKAFVHLSDNSKTTEKDIIRYCSEHLEDYSVPKYVILCSELPKTLTGKVQKRDLQ